MIAISAMILTENASMATTAIGYPNAKNGAGDEIRTHDIHLGKVALYH